MYNDSNINAGFATRRRQVCPAQGGVGDGNLAPLDAFSSVRFDNGYFRNLLSRFGLLHSDQELFNGGSQDALVRQYAANPTLFASDLVTAMIKMGSLTPPSGTPTQIRRHCRVVNS